eukprot:15354470-Ditylum_brightwellii.AAC.2
MATTSSLRGNLMYASIPFILLSLWNTMPRFLCEFVLDFCGIRFMEVYIQGVSVSIWCCNWVDIIPIKAAEL